MLLYSILIPALLVVTQRPRELTRQQLKELRLALDLAGYSQVTLQTMVKIEETQLFSKKSGFWARIDNNRGEQI